MYFNYFYLFTCVFAAHLIALTSINAMEEFMHIEDSSAQSSTTRKRRERKHDQQRQTNKHTKLDTQVAQQVALAAQPSSFFIFPTQPLAQPGQQELFLRTSCPTQEIHKIVSDNNYQALPSLVIMHSKSIVNLRSQDQQTPLGRAAEYGFLRMVQTLIEHGAYVNESSRYSPLLLKTIKHMPYENYQRIASAEREARNAILKCLIYNGARFDLADRYGSADPQDKSTVYNSNWFTPFFEELFKTPVERTAVIGAKDELRAHLAQVKLTREQLPAFINLCAHTVGQGHIDAVTLLLGYCTEHGVGKELLREALNHCGILSMREEFYTLGSNNPYNFIKLLIQNFLASERTREGSYNRAPRKLI